MRIAAFVLLTVVCGGALAADQPQQVYRTVDANGSIVYSDRPINDRSERVTITTTRGSSAATTSSSSRASSNTGASSATTATAAPPAPPPLPPGSPTAAQLLLERQKNCATARERQDRYALAPRLYRTAENGERQYLNEEEIAKERTRAAADVANWCD